MGDAAIVESTGVAAIVESTGVVAAACGHSSARRAAVRHDVRPIVEVPLSHCP